MSKNKSDKPQEVLIIMRSLVGGGAEKVLIDILEHFDYAKYDVTLLLIYREGVYLSKVPPRVRLLSMDSFNGCRPKYVVNRFTVRHWNRYWINTVLEYRTFDTIISFMEGEAMYFHSLITDRAKRNISWVHIDLKSYHWSARFFKSTRHEGNSYAKMDSIVFVSQRAKEQFYELFDINVPSIVIYNLIDKRAIIEKSQAYDVPRSEMFTICNVGRLIDQKRQDRLIEAIALLKTKYSLQVEAWILGEGDCESFLRNKTRALDVEKQVKFLGFKDNPYPYIANADVFVLSSDAEGYPLVLCEAISIGKAVISTNVTGPGEVLGDKCGIICDTSALSIADAIRKLVSDRKALELHERMSEERSQIFNVDGTMERIYNVISAKN